MPGIEVRLSSLLPATVLADPSRLLLVTGIKYCLDCANFYASDVGAVNLYICLRIVTEISQNFTGRGNFSVLRRILLPSSVMWSDAVL